MTKKNRGVAHAEGFLSLAFLLVTQFQRRKPKRPRMRLAMKQNQALNPADGRTFVPRTLKGLMRCLLIPVLPGQAVEIVPKSEYSAWGVLPGHYQ